MENRRDKFQFEFVCLEHMGAVTSDLSALCSKAFVSDGMVGGNSGYGNGSLQRLTHVLEQSMFPSR